MSNKNDSQRITVPTMQKKRVASPWTLLIACEQRTPCRTVGYVLSYRPANNDVIRITRSKTSGPFTFNQSFPLRKNFTSQGYHGQPIILAQTTTYLFQESELPKTTDYYTSD